jgi:hypothetical protein
MHIIIIVPSNWMPASNLKQRNMSLFICLEQTKVYEEIRTSNKTTATNSNVPWKSIRITYIEMNLGLQNVKQKCYDVLV